MDPLPAAAMRSILERYARLVARLHTELGEPPLVLPTSDFFPDVFRQDQRSLGKLLRRMQKHAGLSDIPIRAWVVGAPETSAGGGCGTGGCGAGSCAVPDTDEELPRLQDEGDGWRINIPEAELAHSVVLTANLARALGYVFLMETRAEDEALEEPVDATAELAAVALGFGVLLLEGSYMYSKSCGGPKVQRVTRLSCPELAVAFSAFVTRGRHPLRRALGELGTTQRAVLEETHPWIDANASLSEALQKRPERVAEGSFELEEPRPWLVRLFGKRRRAAGADLDANLDELEAMVSAMPAVAVAGAPAQKAKRGDPRRDELRDLVDEALGSVRADAE